MSDKSVDQPIDLVLSFDTTGSMYPCLREVRNQVDALAQRLIKEIPNLKIAIVAHGDYCDANRPYITKHLALTADPHAISYFVNNVERTGGGDAPEAYELVLKEVRDQIKWTAGSKRVLVMIGDDIPHAKAHNPGRIDWREEAKGLTNDGVLIHGVQCLNRSYATAFYRELAEISGGFHIALSQFQEAAQMILAISYQQQGADSLQRYEEELVTTKKMTRTMADIFNKLSNRDPSTGRYRKVDARAVSASRFQRIDVSTDQAIKDLVESNGLEFQRGRGFYEFTKSEKIQATKEVVILDTETGDMYEGDAAREVLGLPAGEAIQISPRTAGFDTNKYKVFVQSTSNNRKLIKNTTFLYEAE